MNLKCNAYYICIVNPPLPGGLYDRKRYLSFVPSGEYHPCTWDSLHKSCRIWQEMSTLKGWVMNFEITVVSVRQCVSVLSLLTWWPNFEKAVDDPTTCRGQPFQYSSRIYLVKFDQKGTISWHEKCHSHQCPGTLKWKVPQRSVVSPNTGMKRILSRREVSCNAANYKFRTTHHMTRHPIYGRLSCSIVITQDLQYIRGWVLK